MKIVNADSRDVLGDYNDYFDLIVTSPPYADARKKFYDSVHPDDYKEWFVTFHKPFYDSLKDSGSLILNLNSRIVKGVRHRFVWHTIEAMSSLGWLCIDDYIWHKTNPIPGSWPNKLHDGWEYLFHLSKTKRPYFNKDKVKQPIGNWADTRLKNLSKADMAVQHSTTGSPFRRRMSDWVGKKSVLPSNVLHLSTENQNQGHPAVYPESIPEFFIKLLCPPDGVVCDPFGGSGTTGVIATKLGVECVLFEKEAKYCVVIQRRFLNEFGMEIAVFDK